MTAMPVTLPDRVDPEVQKLINRVVKSVAEVDRLDSLASAARDVRDAAIGELRLGSEWTFAQIALLTEYSPQGIHKICARQGIAYVAVAGPEE